MINRLVTGVIVLGVISVGGMLLLKPSTVTVINEEVAAPQVETKEPTEEEKRLAELMKIKEQEARLEVQLDLQKEELAAKEAEFDSAIAALEKERDDYVAAKEGEIKATEAQLADFIKNTAVSRN